MKKEGTKICKYCKSEIPADAKICPNCRKKQGPKIWLFIVGAIILIAIFAAVFGGSNDNTPVSVNDPETNTGNESQTAKTEFNQDETVLLDGVEYQVTNVTKTKGSDFDSAKEGYEYVVVTVKITNNSEEKISYNPLYWKMENSMGQEESQAFTIVDSDTSLNSGDLNPDGTVEGTIAFEQPEGDQGLKLNYYGLNLYDDSPLFKIIID